MHKSPWITIVIIASLLASAGCGTPCERIQSRRIRFLQRAPLDASPHLSLLIPLAWANEIIQEEVSSIKPFRLDTSSFAPVRGIPDLTVKVTSLRWTPEASNRIGFEIRLAIGFGKHTPAFLKLEGAVPIRYDPAHHTLRMTVTAASLKSIKPRIETGSAQILANQLRRALPAALRPLVTTGRVQEWANALLEGVVTDGYALLRSTVLEHLGSLAVFEISLPPLPLAQIELTTRGVGPGMARIDFTTTLPIEKSPNVPAPPRPVRKGHPFRVAMSIDTLAELGNWAISQGKVPSRYNAQGEPDLNGPYEVALDWANEPRPFKAIAWQLGDTCVEAHFGGYLGIAVHDKQVAVEVTDGRLESLIGPPGASLALLLESLWAPTVAFTRTTVATISFQVAGRKIALQLKKGAVSQGDILLDGIFVEMPTKKVRRRRPK